MFVSKGFSIVLVVEVIEIFEKLLDDWNILCIHDDVHDDHNYLLIELSGTRVISEGKAILEHTH